MDDAGGMTGERAWAALASAGRAAFDMVLPPRCPSCGVIVAHQHSFCVDCWSTIRFLGDPCCMRCGLPFAFDVGPDAQCGGCMADPPPFDRARAALAYGEVARKIALSLKYGRQTGLARLMARYMARHLDLTGGATPLLVPVPLHRWRIWNRGFNQAAEIARVLARDTGAAICPDALVRVRRTPPLREMNARQRARAVKGAFAVNSRRAAALRGAHVVLIDDVWTSGATASACAGVLRRSGAARVDLICWARVLPDD